MVLAFADCMGLGFLGFPVYLAMVQRCTAADAAELGTRYFTASRAVATASFTRIKISRQIRLLWVLSGVKLRVSCATLLCRVLVYELCLGLGRVCVCAWQEAANNAR